MTYCFEQGIPHSEYLSWDPEDRAKVAAFAMERSERCPACGTAEWEWEQDRFAYTAVRMVCQGCQQKDLVRDDDSAPSPAGSSVALLPRAVVERLAEQHKPRPRRRAVRGSDE